MERAGTNGHVVDSRARGSNQSGLRAHNERAVLSLIRRYGELAKADIARRTGLSAQTASVIMRALEAEELVIREKPRRGRVGQPSVPMRLNPDGALSLGLKIGRRSSELVLMDFIGRIRASERRTYAYPMVEDIRDFVSIAFERLVGGLDAKLRGRIVGLGVAMPFELWSWADEIGAPAGDMAGWRDFDVAAELEAMTGLSVHLANDASAACAAENVFGTVGASDFVYFFVGAFAGGGIVLSGDLMLGRRGNAGALGSLPIPRKQGGSAQLINFASLHVLEKMIKAEGGDPLAIWRDDAAWESLGPILDLWIETAAYGLAYAILSAHAVNDLAAAVIDGGFPRPVLDRLVEATKDIYRGLDRQGLFPITIEAGSVGTDARALGAASLPFFARFLMDQRAPYAERAS